MIAQNTRFGKNKCCFVCRPTTLLVFNLLIEYLCIYEGEEIGFFKRSSATTYNQMAYCGCLAISTVEIVDNLQIYWKK